MMGPDEDLPTLMKRKDHLNVLRYIRAHELREPKLVLEHGKALLGGDALPSKLGNESAYLAALEQICLAALDVAGQDALADLCLTKLKGIVSKDAVRYRRLLARCLEAAGEYDDAEKIYDALLAENPANSIALQRKYCIVRAQGKDTKLIMEALNNYLAQNMSDTSGWYEMVQLQLSISNYKGAAYALENVILACPLESSLHVQLSEVYATIGGMENLTLARKHMAQALELDATNLRAQFGLVAVATQYLEEAKVASKKDVDEHENLVAQELVKYGVTQVLKSYKGTKLYGTVKSLMDDHTSNLE